MNEISTKYGMEPPTSSFLISFRLGLGLEYKINERIKIELNPHFKQSLTSFYNNTNFNFSAIGINTNLLYEF